MKNIKKGTYNLITSVLAGVIFVGFFLFFAIKYEGHFAFWEGNNYWEFTPEYFLKSLQPAGLTLYIAAFLQMFYHWHYVGCVLLLLMPAVVYLSTRSIFRTLQISDEFSPLMLLPYVALSLFLSDKLCFLSIGVCVAFFYFAMAVYMRSVKGQGVGRAVFVSLLLYPFLFFFLPSGVVLCFYLVLCAADLLLLKGVKRSVLLAKNVLTIVLAVLMPILWSFLVNNQLPTTACLLDMALNTKISWSKIVFFYLFPFCILIACVFLQRKTIKTIKWLCFVSSLLLLLPVVYSYSVYKKELGWERFFQIESACSESNWEKLLQITEYQKQKIDNLFPFTIVALAAQGQLPEKMFEYPLTAQGAFLPPSDLKNINIQANVAFYQQCGMLNMAIAYAFQNSSIRTNEYDILTLKQLARLNALAGADDVSEKYLNKLHKTLFYNDFIESCKQMKKEPVEQDVCDSVLFFGSGVKHVELISLLDRKYNPVAADLLLCMLLKMRDCNNFVKYFFAYYPYRNCEVLPKAYEEFLVMAPFANIALPATDFKISAATQHRFEQFYAIYTANTDNRIKKVQLKPFADTWFYYAVYGK